MSYEREKNKSQSLLILQISISKSSCRYKINFWPTRLKLEVGFNGNNSKNMFHHLLIYQFKILGFFFQVQI